MPVLKGGGVTGDLFIEVQVETPVKLSKKQKELLRTFEKEGTEGIQPATESFFARAREFLGSGSTH
jgi:molecular chaperone DnaJ